MKRLLSLAAALAVVVASAAVLASAASADQPVRFPLSPGSFTISGVCSFDVQATLIADRQFEIVFSNGAAIITGREFYQLTNETTGKSLVANFSGPAFISPDGEVVATGVTGVFGFAALSGLLLLHGPVMYDFANNTFTTTSASLVDLCAALS